MRNKKTILSLLILLISNFQINSQSLKEGAVHFTKYIGDFYVNASGDLAIDYVFYDDQPEVKLRWNWFQINFIEYKGVNYSAQNNQIDQSYFGYKKKDFYGDIKITERVPTIMGYSDKTKEIYAGAVNTSFTFKVDQNKWNSLSSSKKSNEKKSWKDKISPYSINLVSIKGPVIEDAFRAIKKHIAKKENKAKKIKELNFKFASLKSRFESSKKNLTVPSIRLGRFNKYLAEAKSLHSSLKILDETHAYRIKSFIETLEKKISSTKSEIKQKKFKEKLRESKKEAEKKRLEKEISITKVKKRLTTQERLEKNYKQLDKKMNNLTTNIANSIINSSRQKQKEQFRRKQEKIDKRIQNEKNSKEYYTYAKGVWQEYANVTNKYIRLLKIYTENEESLSLNNAIQNATKNNIEDVYMVFLNAGKERLSYVRDSRQTYSKNDDRIKYYYTKPIKIPVKQLSYLKENGYDALLKKADKESKKYGDRFGGYNGQNIRHLIFSDNKEYLTKMTNYFYDNIPLKKTKIKNNYLDNWSNVDLNPGINLKSLIQNNRLGNKESSYYIKTDNDEIIFLFENRFIMIKDAKYIKPGKWDNRISIKNGKTIYPEWQKKLFYNFSVYKNSGHYALSLGDKKALKSGYEIYPGILNAYFHDDKGEPLSHSTFHSGSYYQTYTKYFYTNPYAFWDKYSNHIFIYKSKNLNPDKLFPKVIETDIGAYTPIIDYRPKIFIGSYEINSSNTKDGNSLKLTYKDGFEFSNSVFVNKVKKVGSEKGKIIKYGGIPSGGFEEKSFPFNFLRKKGRYIYPYQTQKYKFTKLKIIDKEVTTTFRNLFIKNNTPTAYFNKKNFLDRYKFLIKKINSKDLIKIFDSKYIGVNQTNNQKITFNNYTHFNKFYTYLQGIINDTKKTKNGKTTYRGKFLILNE